MYIHILEYEKMFNGSFMDSPLSSKVAMFNQQVDQHKQSQHLNPFTTPDGRASPKPTFSKTEYGKPLAGSLTEMRGQKANMHVLKEMLELCQIIDSEGYAVKDEPSMRVIPFGELFNIYNYISDKVVGILLRARKHKLVEFEGEMLFQRRDDDVPVFLLKPILEIRREMDDKIDTIKRCGSSSPQATTVLLDKKGLGLAVPRGATPRSSVSRTPSPQSSKAGTPVRDVKSKAGKAQPIIINKIEQDEDILKTELLENKPNDTNNKLTAEEIPPIPAEKISQSTNIQEETKPKQVEVVTAEQQSPVVQEVVLPPVTAEPTAKATEVKTDVNNNNNNNTSSDLPTIIIEASAVYERPANIGESSHTENTVPCISESNTSVESTVNA